MSVPSVDTHERHEFVQHVELEHPAVHHAHHALVHLHPGGLAGLAENQLAVMLAEAGLRSGKRRDLAGRLPGFALLQAVPALEFGTGTYD